MDALTDPNIEKLTLDVTSDEDVQRVVDYIVEKEGRIDVVVNNAGLSVPSESVLFARIPRITNLKNRSSHRLGYGRFQTRV